jgi:glyoxylase-like metal-dependent hydrolase (beta-lactamase superfamily II)
MTFKLAITSLAALAAAHAQLQMPEVETTDLGDGIYIMTTGVAGNLALLTGDDGAVLVDDQLPNTGSLIEGAIVEIMGEGAPRFIVNTHWHGDHTGGNAHFAALGSTVAAHHNIRTRLDDSEAEWAQQDGVLPILTFGDDLNFHMNGQTVKVIHVPDAHTDGDALVYFREADVLHMGDVLFSGLFPYIDLDSGGTVDGFMAALERGLEIAGPETTVIAGHGPLSTEADIQASLDMVRETSSRVRALVAEGADREAVAEAAPLADYEEDWAWRFITTERMLDALYNDAVARD